MHFVRGLGFGHDLPNALLLPLPHQCSVFLLNALQDMRCAWSPAAVRENRVSHRELGQSDFAAAEECRRIRAKLRTNTRRGTKLQHRLDSRIHPDADRGAILRFYERLPGGHSTFVMVVGILGSPFS